MQSQVIRFDCCNKGEIALHLTISPMLERNSDFKIKFHLHYADECTAIKTFKKTNM